MIKENFIKLYENSFKENWDLPCYTDYGEDTTFTYGQVAEEIAKIHLLFQYCSLRRGDKISIIGKNTSRWCIRLFGNCYIRSYCSSYSTRLQAE